MCCVPVDSFSYFGVFMHELYSSFASVVKQSKDGLVALGFPAFTIEDFHELVCDLSLSV